MPALEIHTASNTMVRGELLIPIDPVLEEAETISEKETIQKYRTTFPHLNQKQFQIRKIPKIDLGMVIDSTEWQQSSVLLLQ